MQVAELRAEITKITSEKKKEAEAIAVNVLEKIFTPGKLRY